MKSESEKQKIIREFHESQLKYISAILRCARANKKCLEFIQNDPTFTLIFSPDDLVEMDQTDQQLDEIIIELAELGQTATLENVSFVAERIDELNPVVSETYYFVNGKFSRLNKTN